MCGISGAQRCARAGSVAAQISSNQIIRGRDSAGVAWPAQYEDSKEVRIFKRVESPSKFFEENREKLAAMNVTAAIGHNRWPSHGMVNARNAHPFKSCDGKFALVHNGSAPIPRGIWNFLEKRGHVIQGDPDPTDSEMFMHSIEELLKANGGDRMLALRAFNKIGQSFSILVLFSDGEIWGTRDSWPLVMVQRNSGETLMASVEEGFRDVVPKDEKVKIILPGPHTIYRVETNGGITLWGDYEKQERTLKQGTVMLDYCYDEGWNAIDRAWNTGPWPVVYTPIDSAHKQYKAAKLKKENRVPDMDLLKEAAALIPDEKFNLDSKKARKRLRKLIRSNLWLREELEDELGLEEGEAKDLFGKEDMKGE